MASVARYKEARLKKLIAVVMTAFILGGSTIAQAHHNDDAPGTDGPNGKTVFVGTNHADDLRGGSAPDAIYALRGDDRLGGEHGGDKLVGGPGDDRFWPGRGKDAVFCGPGRDVVNTLKESPADSYRNCEVIK